MDSSAKDDPADLPAAQGDRGETEYQKALAHHRAGELELAVEQYSRAIRLKPYAPDVYNNFGVALRALGRIQGAIACYRRSLVLRPQAAGVLTNLGNAFRELGETDRAISAHQRALKLAPENSSTRFNAALALRDGGQSQLALKHFQKALALDPTNHQARIEMGLTLLKTGDWQEGFTLFETRNRLNRNAPSRSDIPMWQGTSLAGKSLLITAEGNLGTIVMMARFAKVLKQTGAHITMEAPPPLIGLLELSHDVDRVVGIGEKVSGIDLQVPLLSIPARLGTTMQTLPNQTPYLGAPVSASLELNIEPGVKLAVGLVWNGGGANAHRRFGQCHLADLMEIMALPGLRTFSLEPGPTQGEITEIGVQDLIESAGSKAQDLAQLAAIIEQLDLVIAVDSIAAHLAGALGKPVWLLADERAEWCWLEDREDSPWYPSMRIFRKSKNEDWPELASRGRKELQAILTQGG